MEHLDENKVVELFERRLPGEAIAQLEVHTATCDACRQLVAAYARMSPAPPRGTAPFDARVLEGQSPPSPPAPPEAPLLPDEARAHLGRRIARAVAEKRVGTLLSNRWRIDRLIDTGGMAQVYAATHRNGRPVAIKVLRPELSVVPELVQRFLREGYVANKVQHPGAVAVLDDDVGPDGAPFLVMELLVGRTLRTRVTDDGPLPTDDALRLMGDLLAVLGAAHARGIVHRDIKPENLFETEERVLKVLDFGIARLRELALGASKDEGGEEARPDTQTGTTMGTIGYMAPEQARGEPDGVDARSDLWAVGATLYTLLTGHVLHEAPTTNAGLLLAMTVPVAPMAELAPNLPRAVRELLDTALSFDKTARFSDADAMARAAEAARALPPSVRRPLAPSLPPLRRRSLAPFVGVTLALAVVTALVVAMNLRPEQAPAAAAPAPSVTASATSAIATTPAVTPEDLPLAPAEAAPTKPAPRPITKRPAAPAASAAPAAKAPAADPRDPLGSRH